jgi:sensor histidine kinase YesM
MRGLTITKKDWIFIVGIGTIIGSVNGYTIYSLLQLKEFDGLVFGAITGLYISLLSSMFITVLNQRLLPSIHKRFWYPLAFLFSFSSGSLGSLGAFYTFNSFSYQMIPLYRDNIVVVSVSMGILTYLIGLILYLLISVKAEKERLNSLLIESRLKSLEGQLNPHFIFNALNSISELVYMDQDLAETTILKLSKFLRDGMGEQSQIDLKSELEIVKNYVWLENIRFNGVIELKIELNGVSDTAQIPKFSVQLLVENAIKHSFRGFQRGDKKFQIDIVAKSSSNGFYISVLNSGKPIENLKFGIGLNNLKSRISILNRGSIEYRYVDSKIMFRIDLKEN